MDIHGIKYTLVILVQLLLGGEIFCLLKGLVENFSGFAASLLQGLVDGGGMLLEERQDNPGQDIIKHSDKTYPVDNYLE